MVLYVIEATTDFGRKRAAGEKNFKDFKTVPRILRPFQSLKLAYLL